MNRKTTSKSKFMKPQYRLLVIIASALAITFLVGLWLWVASKPITSFEQCVAAGNAIQDSYPQTCRTASGKSFTQPLQGGLKTIEGTIACLPHKNTDGPQTLECAAGLKTNDGTYYSLKINDPNHALTSKTGSNQIVRITGKVTDEPDSIYQSAGLLTVESYEFIQK
jgi:hypothetical protein